MTLRQPEREDNGCILRSTKENIETVQLCIELKGLQLSYANEQMELKKLLENLKERKILSFVKKSTTYQAMKIYGDACLNKHVLRRMLLSGDKKHLTIRKSQIVNNTNLARIYHTMELEKYFLPDQIFNNHTKADCVESIIGELVFFIELHSEEEPTLAKSAKKLLKILYSLIIKNATQDRTVQYLEWNEDLPWNENPTTVFNQQ